MDNKQIRAFRRDLRSFSRILAQQVEVCCSNVTPAQCHVLLALEESDPLSNAELAGLMQLDASTLSRTVDQLNRKGLVIRRPHPNDRRATLLELSDRGGQAAAGIHASADALYRGILEKIPEDRRSDVLRGFTQLVDAFAGWQAHADGKCSP